MVTIVVTSPPSNSVSVPTPSSGTASPGLVQVQPSNLPDQIEVYTFSYGGHLATYTGLGRFYLDIPVQIRSVRFSLGTVASADTVLDLKHNGTSVFTTQPTILQGEYTTAITTGYEIVNLARGDYLTVDIISVGLAMPGTDLTVILRVKRLA